MVTEDSCNTEMALLLREQNYAQFEFVLTTYLLHNSITYRNLVCNSFANLGESHSWLIDYINNQFGMDIFVRDRRFHQLSFPVLYLDSRCDFAYTNIFCDFEQIVVLLLDLLVQDCLFEYYKSSKKAKRKYYDLSDFRFEEFNRVQNIDKHISYYPYGYRISKSHLVKSQAKLTMNVDLNKIWK